MSLGLPGMWKGAGSAAPGVCCCDVTIPPPLLQSERWIPSPSLEGLLAISQYSPVERDSLGQF